MTPTVMISQKETIFTASTISIEWLGIAVECVELPVVLLWKVSINFLYSETNHSNQISVAMIEKKLKLS